MKRFIIFYLAIILLTGSGYLSAQVAIAPSTIFISDQTNVGTVFLSNRSDDPQEVTIDFTFGYPSSDEDGNLVMVYDDLEISERYSIDNLIRAFPRSFVLAPREQQTVRFQMRPMMQSPDGMYWTRVRILANPQSAEIGLPTEEEISTRITFRFEQIIAAFYRKGSATTGLEVTGVDVRHENDRTILLPRLKRTGNSPYIGSMTARMYNPAGNMVLERQATITAYFDEIRRLELDTDELPAGDYRVELTFETRRGDMSPTDLVQAAPLTQTVQIVIP